MTQATKIYTKKIRYDILNLAHSLSSPKLDPGGGLIERRVDWAFLNFFNVIFLIILLRIVIAQAEVLQYV